VGGAQPEEPVLWVGHSPEEHGLLREIACGTPHVVMCRLCKGEKDCPWVAARSPLRVRVVHVEPDDPVEPVERTVRTGMHAAVTDRPAKWFLPAIASLAWLTVVLLVLLFWIVDPPTWREALGLLGLKAGIFVFVIVGVPLVRTMWALRGGRTRRRT
jgi:hypothetical protein